MDSSDHRQHRRARVLLPVTLRLGANQPPIFGVATDLSVGGLFLLDDARLESADHAAIELELEEGRTVKTEARIVRLQKPERPRGLDVPGVGLEFVELPPTAASAIADLVEHKAA